jgi:hypothetical protein
MDKFFLQTSILYLCIKKLYSYDGVPMDGFEERIKIPNISDDVLE